MIIKMTITFDYNPETNEYTPLKQEIVKEKQSPAIKLAKEAKDSAEPQITLADNKYILNASAADFIGVKWEDRLDIKYQLIDNIKFPIIGKAESWGTKSGNKLTKSLTVSCRGTANSVLAEYGDTFTITPWKGHEGLFVLIGNKDKEPDLNIDIKEPEELESDLPEEVFNEDILEESTEDFELKDIDFEL